jgi:hypothetical protein
LKPPTILKKVIQDFIKQNETVSDFLQQGMIGGDKIDLFRVFLQQTNFNIALGTEFAQALQLVNDNDLVDTYDLSDIAALFTSLLKTQGDNIETYVEAAHFEWAVVGDEQKAKSIAESGILKAKAKITELEKLLEEIHNDTQNNGA